MASKQDNEYKKRCQQSLKDFKTAFRGPQRQYKGSVVGSAEHKTFLQAKHDLMQAHYERCQAAYSEIYGAEAYERSCKNGTWNASETVLRDLREAYEKM